MTVDWTQYYYLISAILIMAGALIIVHVYLSKDDLKISTDKKEKKKEKKKKKDKKKEDKELTEEVKEETKHKPESSDEKKPKIKYSPEFLKEKSYENFYIYRWNNDRVICSECGVENSLDAKKCILCGMRLG